MKLERKTAYKGLFIIDVYRNATATSPRENENNIVEFVCRNSGRKLGDKHNISNVINQLFEEYAVDAEIIDWFRESRNAKYYEGEQVTAEITPYHETCDCCYVWKENGERRTLAFNSRNGSSPTDTGICEELADWEKFAILSKSDTLVVKLLSEYTTDDGRICLSFEDTANIGPNWERDYIGFAWVTVDAMSRALGRDYESSQWNEAALDRMGEELTMYEAWLNGGFYECQVLGEDIYGNEVGFFRDELLDESGIKDAIADAKEAIDCHLSCIEGTAEQSRKNNIDFISNHTFLPNRTDGVFGVVFTDDDNACILSPNAGYGKVNVLIASISSCETFDYFKKGRLEDLSDEILYNIVKYYKENI